MDKRSGVSQRLPISVLENAVSNAERRALRWTRSEVVPRVSDVYAAVPSITGKLELEYEGELQGGDTIARELIRRAAGTGAGRAPGRRRPREDRRLVRPGRRAQGPGRRARRARASRDSAWCPGCVELVPSRPRRPGATRRERWRHASWCSRASPRRSGSAGARSWVTPGQSRSGGSRVWQGGDFVRIDGKDGRRRRKGRSRAHPPSFRPFRPSVFTPTPTPSPAPRSPPPPRRAPAPPVFSTMWIVDRIVPVAVVVLPVIPRPHLVGVVQDLRRLRSDHAEPLRRPRGSARRGAPPASRGARRSCWPSTAGAARPTSTTRPCAAISRHHASR